MRTSRLWLPAVLVALAPLPAQDLGLTVLGGSVPGQVRMTAGPYVPDGVFGVVFISVQTTSIPWAVLDPSDPRSLSVGLELGAVSPFGLVSGGAGVYQAPPIGIPNQASFVDGALFFQSTYIPGPQYFIGPMSLPTVLRFGPAGQFWSRGQIMNAQRAFFPALPLPNGKVLIPGGGSGGMLSLLATSQADVYDPLTDSFEYGLFMTDERALHTATVLFDGRILLIGGVNQTNDPAMSIEIFDPATGQFTPGAPMAYPRMGHSATLLNDGRVLVAGGLADMNPGPSGLDPVFSSQDTTEIYDPFMDTWTAGPTMSARRSGHGAFLLADGRVLLAGGLGWITWSSIRFPEVEQTTEIYDPVSNTLSAGPPMASRRALFTIIDVGGGRQLATGGIDDLDLINQGTPTDTAEIYDPTAHQWTSVASMATPRGLHAAFEYGPGRFIHIMGANGSILAPTPLSSTEIYDVAADQWLPGPVSPTPRAAFGAYANGHGQIHVLGGSDGSPVGAVNSDAWVYR